jgi:hypothetical protein
MTCNLSSHEVARHPERVQASGVVGKAVLNKVQKAETWANEGRILWVATKLSRRDDGEVAALLAVAKSQLSAWFAGLERPQTERFRASDIMRGYLLVAEALADPARFDTFVTIQVRL